MIIKVKKNENARGEVSMFHVRINMTNGFTIGQSSWWKHQQMKHTKAA
jgi:hypothetical protein